MGHHHAAGSEPPRLAIRPFTLLSPRVGKKQSLISGGREYSRIFVWQKRFEQKMQFFYLFLAMVFNFALKQSISAAFFIFFRKLRLKCELLVKSASHYPYSIGNYDFFLFKNFSNFSSKFYPQPPAHE